MTGPLTDLAAVCRRTGRPVIEVDGWQTRGRGGSGGHGTGGYTGSAPSHVMVHHTASGASSDGWPDVNYCTFGDEDAPLCNLYLDRAGVIYVCAAMATNTNGSGVDPCGHLDPDTMNANAIGIEAGNDGQGETWPPAQLDACLAVVAALGAAYGIPTSRVHGHAEYAPARKVDPAGPDRYAHGASTWDMAAFRADLDPAGPDPLPPDPGGDDVDKYLCRDVDGWPWVTDLASYAVQITEDQAARGVELRGYVKGADNEPFPLDAQDSDLVRRIASRWGSW